MSVSKALHLLGYASGLAAADPGSSDGPEVMQKSPYLAELVDKGVKLKWDLMIKPDLESDNSKLAMIATQCQQLAARTEKLTSGQEFFSVLGGDHSCAIGTWSGVAHAIKDKGDLGLIWIDAHMDSHTPHTSLSGNIHGMPIASLLGYGTPSLVNILNNQPKIKPEHLCLIGVRSFERGEAALLKQLNVKIFFMEEVKQRGLNVIMQEALDIVSKGTAGFGLSIDIDSMDPNDAPGTGCPEPNGISAKELCQSLRILTNAPNLLGTEIVEFDPHRDIDHKTEKLVSHLIAAIALGNRYHAVIKNCCSHADTITMR